MQSYEAKRTRSRILLTAQIAASILAVLVSLTLGAAQIPLSEAITAVFGGMPGTATATILFNVRLPRALCSYVVGAALAVSGACMQGVFQNPMADPHLLGVSSGAGLGVALSVMIFGSAALSTSVMAFIFALGAVGMVVLLSHGGGSKAGTLNLLLSGVAVSSFLSALTSGIMILNREKMDEVYMWTMGSFTSASWSKLSVAAPVIILGALGIIAFARELNAMLLGEEGARSLGVRVAWVRVALLLLATLITAMAVSVSGVIGFVGLMIPHMTRMLTGSDHRTLLPLCFTGGGLYLLIMDTLARTVAMPIEIPIGVLTALMGGPFFVYLLRKRRK